MNRIVENPEPFNHKTSKVFFVIGVVFAVALTGLAIWLLASAK
jgi:uncharacterized membrane protein YsdA (DUF1294 family)